MKKLFTILLIAILTIASVGCATKIEAELMDAINKILNEHSDALIALVDTWIIEDRRPTTQERDTLVEYVRKDKILFERFITKANSGMNTSEIAALVFSTLGLKNIGEYVGGYDPGSGYDPRLEQIVMFVSELRGSVKELDRRLGLLEKRVDAVERRMDKAEADIRSLKNDDGDNGGGGIQPIIDNRDDAILFMKEFRYTEQNEGVLKTVDLTGLDTNNWYVECEVNNLPYNEVGRAFLPLFTITNKDMLEQTRRDPRLNGGRMSIVIMGGNTEWRAGMVNLFWNSDNNRSLNVVYGDETEFEEWRTPTGKDWTQRHKIRVEFRSAGKDVVTATLYVDGERLASRTALYYCPNPILAFSGYHFDRSNWLNPVGGIITNLVIDNLEGR